MKLTHPKLIFAALMILPLPAMADTGITANSLAHDTAQFANKTVNLVKDSAITGYIYAQIALDNNLSKLNLNVSTDHGVVTLQGKVNSDSEASSVIQIASSASGVTAVDASQLHVAKSTQPFTDLAITAMVKGTFIREKLFDKTQMPANIGVETNNGVVYLTGTASNGVQVQDAIRLARSISGVKRVESTIKVVNSPS